MKKHVALWGVLILVCLTLAGVSAMAAPATLFQTGHGTGTSGDSISMSNGPEPGNTVANQWTCSTPDCLVAGFTFETFNGVAGGNTGSSSISWLFSGAKPFNFKNVCGGGPCSGTSTPFTIGDCLPVCLESVTLPTPIDLPGGVNWLNLFNEVNINPAEVTIWSTNDGTGQLSSSEVLSATGGVVVVGPPGDAFGVFGTPTVPEPGSILLLGSGLLGAAGVLRRKLIR